MEILEFSTGLTLLFHMQPLNPTLPLLSILLSRVGAALLFSDFADVTTCMTRRLEFCLRSI